MSSKERAGLQKNKLDAWIKASKNRNNDFEGETLDKPMALNQKDETFPKVVAKNVVKSSSSNAGHKRPREDADNDNVTIVKKTLVECPICTMQVADTQINEHLDMLHP